MTSLGSWMNKILIDWGIDPKLANMFDESIIAVLMIALSIGLDYLCQAIFVGGMKRYTKRSPHKWNTLTAPDAESAASSDTCLARHPDLFFIAFGFCTGQGDVGVLTKDMCGIYNYRCVAYCQRSVVGYA